MSTVGNKMLACLVGVLALACATAPQSKSGRQDLVSNAHNAIRSMQAADPSLGSKMRSSYAYAAFPGVGEGAFVVGGEYGRGVVFKNNQVMGFASLQSASVGLQAGGQTFDELVLFQDQAALERMINQGLSFTSQAEATALQSGAAAQTNFRNGMAIFIKPVGGLIGSLSVAGQSIRFVPSGEAQRQGWLSH